MMMIIIIIIIMLQISNKVLNEKFGSNNRKSSTDSLQKIAYVRRTSHIIQNVLLSEN